VTIDIFVSPYLVLALRLSIGTILLFAGVSKVGNMRGFSEGVLSYGILPVRLVRLFAFGLPYLEIVTGSSLLVGLRTRVAALVAGLLFMIFAIAIGINLRRGQELECHCFGKVHLEHISPRILLRNLMFAVFTLPIALFANDFLTLDGWLTNKTGIRSPENALLLLLLVLAAVILIILIFVSQQALRKSTVDVHGWDPLSLVKEVTARD
jgi:putative oxidoreductase